MQLTVQADTAAAERSLQRLADNVRDARPFLHDAADQFHRLERKRFDRQGDGDWPGLDADTLEKKAREGLSPRILMATGALRRAMTTRASGSVLRVTRESLEVGTTIPYAEHVNRRRPIVNIDSRDVSRFSRLLVGHVADGV